MKLKYSCLIAGLLAFSNIAYANKDVELSWEKASVYVPGQWMANTSDITVTGPKPVLIYLHGCIGITSHDRNWASAINNMGFIVIMLNSFERPGRISNCDPVAKTNTQAFPRSHEYRQQEITYAIDQVLKSSWADKNNIFLMGHSEGGIAVARANHNNLAGEIISGWTCTNPDPAFHGIKAPKEMPVLSIASVDDEWRKGRPSEGKCSNVANNRSNFKGVDLPGWHHNTYGYAEARQAVQDFLTQYKK